MFARKGLDMSKKTDDDKKDKKIKVIICIIVIIIIILSLITSCSCTSRFFGKLGNIFKNEGDYTIDDGTNDRETIRNQDLKFDNDNLEVSLSDSNVKISFSYQNIDPTQFTCSTSDPNLATCFVSNGYVVVNPKGPGDVVVTLQTNVNGKVYEATVNIKITDATRYIELASYNGTLNLYSSKTKSVSYKLVGLEGKVSAKSSNEDVASVKISNGKVVITGKRTGSAEIMVSINYNGVVYEKIYNLTVINEKVTSSGGNSKPGGTNKPVGPDNPNVPDKPSVDDKKNNDVSLKTLMVNGKSVLGTYYTEVSAGSIKLNAVPKMSSSKIIYNNKEYDSLKDVVVALDLGENKIKFKVRAEDGTEQDYEVIVVRKNGGGSNSNLSSNANLASISLNGEKLKDFAPSKYEYTVSIPIDMEDAKLSVKASSGKATVYMDGKVVDTLNVKLDPGESQEVVIRVKAEDGSSKIYKVTLKKESNYTIKVNDTKCELSGDSPKCFMYYTVYKDGMEDKSIVADKAAFQDTSYGSVSIDKTEPGILVVKPDLNSIYNHVSSAVIKVSYGNKEATGNISFTYNYSLTTSADKYELGVSGSDGNLTGKRAVIIDTNLFNGEVKVVVDGETVLPSNYAKVTGKDVRICSLNGVTCVKLEASGPIKIGYVGENNPNKSIAINVVGNDVTLDDKPANIHMTWTVAGQTAGEKDIKIDVKREYKVVIYANKDETGKEVPGGAFNTFETVYEFKVQKGEVINLGKYDKPYLYKDCKYYLFDYYVDSSGNKYQHTDLKVDSNMTLYTYYKTEVGNAPPKKLYLVDVPLFHNEEYYNKYNKDFVIYPGASGYYTMNIKNDTYDSLNIIGMTLKEDSVCVDNGCLNMGYIVRATDPENKDKNFYYYHGELKTDTFDSNFKDRHYKILHNGIKTDTSYDINFNPAIISGQSGTSDKTIRLNKGETAAITIFWRWVDDGKHDDVDTAIGIMAAEEEAKGKTLPYSLTVSIDFTTKDKNCSN